MKTALAKANIAQSERDRIMKDLKALQEEDQKVIFSFGCFFMAQARKETESLRSKLQSKLDNFCIGGVNLLDENARQAVDIIHTQRELEDQRVTIIAVIT